METHYKWLEMVNIGQSFFVLVFNCFWTGQKSRDSIAQRSGAAPEQLWLSAGNADELKRMIIAIKIKT